MLQTEGQGNDRKSRALAAGATLLVFLAPAWAATRTRAQFGDGGLETYSLTIHLRGETREHLVFASLAAVRESEEAEALARGGLEPFLLRDPADPCVDKDPTHMLSERPHPLNRRLPVAGELMAAGTIRRVVSGVSQFGPKQALEVQLDLDEFNHSEEPIWILIQGGDFDVADRRACSLWRGTVPREGDRLLFGTSSELLAERDETTVFRHRYFSIGLVRRGAVVQWPHRIERPDGEAELRAAMEAMAVRNEEIARELRNWRPEGPP